MSGYVMVPGWLLDLQPDGAELRMYCTLARFGRFDTVAGVYEECRPAMSTAAEAAGMSLAHAKRAIAGLLEKGAITRSERWAEDGKTRLPSVYRVIFGSLVGPSDERGRLADEPGGRLADEPGVGSPVSQNPEPNTQNQNTQKKDSSSASPRRGTRLPEDFYPDAELRRWYVDNIGNAIDGQTEHEKFKDYWTAQPGAKGVKLDWRATWRNWMRTAMERSGRRPTSGAPAGAAQAPRYPSAAEREQARRDAEHQRLLDVEAWMEANGMDPENHEQTMAVLDQIKAGKLTIADRTVMPYIDGEVVREDGAKKEVTSYASE